MSISKAHICTSIHCGWSLIDNILSKSMFLQALLVWAINSMHSLKIQLCIFAGRILERCLSPIYD